MLHLQLLLSLVQSAGAWLSGGSRRHPDEYRVAVLGARNAGKTQLTYRLARGGGNGSAYRVPEPTQGIHETTLELPAGRRLTLVEVGGAARLLPLWSRLLRLADAVIYVVDFADPDSWPEARDRLHDSLLTDRSFTESGCPILLLAAKADAARHGQPAIRLVRELRLCRIRHHRWHLQSVGAARRRDDEPADKSLGRALRQLLRMVDDNRRRTRRLQRRLQAVRAAAPDAV